MKFRNWYGRTLESYRVHFGEKPPEDVWPVAEERFRARAFKRVDAGEVWMLPKRMVKMVASLSLLGSILVGCDDGDESNFFVVGVVGLVGLLVIWLMSGGGGGPGRGAGRRRGRRDGGGGFFLGCGSGCSSDSGGSAGCGSSGCGGGGCGGD